MPNTYPGFIEGITLLRLKFYLIAQFTFTVTADVPNDHCLLAVFRYRYSSQDGIQYIYLWTT